MKKLSAFRKAKKGFTLVEIIVVLVIIAILAAIATPLMLGYIDDAKEKQISAEARAVLQAVNTQAVTEYAADGSVVLADITIAELNGWIGSDYVTGIVATADADNDNGEVALTISTTGKVTSLIYSNDGIIATYDGSTWAYAEA